MARVRYILEIESESTPEIEALANTVPAWEQAGPPRPRAAPAEQSTPGPFSVWAVPDALRLLARTEEISLADGGDVMAFGTLRLEIRLPDDTWIEVRAALTEEHVAELAAHVPRVEENLRLYREEQALSDGPDDPEDE